MSDPPEPPRVRLALPGEVPARLLRWRQDEAGRWWAEVTLVVPVDAVQRVEGEDYAGVPRLAAPPPPPEYVVQTLPGGQLVLHQADCWAATGGRITSVPPGIEKTALRFEDTDPCDICHPLT